MAAAQKVLSAPWKKITITPLDTCGLVTLSGERFQKLVKSDDPLVKAVLENYRIWAKKGRVSELQSSSILYDTAAIYLAYPRHAAVKAANALNFSDRRRHYESRSERAEHVGGDGME